MQNIVALVDNSKNAQDILLLLQRLKASLSLQIKLLHILEKNQFIDEYDLSGTIGLGARSHLLQEFSAKDAKIASKEIEKARSFMEKIKEKLQKENICDVTIELRHGTILQALQDNIINADMVVMGKRGENSKENSLTLGAHFEEIVQNCQKPLLIAANVTSPQKNSKIENICIAYDGSQNADNIIDYLCEEKLFSGANLFCFMIGENNENNHTLLHQKTKKLSESGYKVTYEIKAGDVISLLLEKITNEPFDLFMMGAYGHNLLRRLLIGSTTHALIQKSTIPVLIIR